MDINDKLDALITLTAKDCGNDDVEMFNNLDTTKIKLDNKFYIKLRQIIRKHRHSTAIILVKKCFVRVAVALMALMSLGFLTIMATPDFREALFEAVIEWYDNYISIRYEPVDNDTYETDITEKRTDVSQTETLEDEDSVSIIVVPPTKIEKVMKPSFIPEGIEEEIVIINKSTVTIDYYCFNELYYTYHQTLFRNNEKLFDDESIIIKNTEINGMLATIIEHDNQSEKAIVWTDGVYYYHIISYSGEISVEQLIKIASSIS